MNLCIFSKYSSKKWVFFLLLLFQLVVYLPPCFLFSSSIYFVASLFANLIKKGFGIDDLTLIVDSMVWIYFHINGFIVYRSWALCCINFDVRHEVSLVEKKRLFQRLTCIHFNLIRQLRKKNKRMKKTFLFICCSRKEFSGLIKLVPCLDFKNIFQFQLLDSHSTRGDILRYVYYYNQWQISFDGIFVPLSSLWPNHSIPFRYCVSSSFWLFFLFITMLTNLQLNLKLFRAWND